MRAGNPHLMSLPPKNKPRKTMTTQKQIRKAFWENHPLHETHARKWGIKTAPHNRHNSETRTAFVDFVDTLARNGEISGELANRATL